MTGKEIREARLAKGLTQEELAQAIRVSLSSVHRWETGKVTPSLLSMERIKQVLA